LKVAAIAEVLASGSVGGVTLAAVAARAAVAKPTAYLYFASKEVLLVEALTDELEVWFESLLAPPDVDRRDARAFAEHFADTLLARPALVLLLAALHAVLEPGLDPASALAFKEVLGQALTEADVVLGAQLPGFGPGDAARLLLRAHALVVGLAGMAAPPPAVREALARPDLAWMAVDLRTELVGAVEAWVRAGPSEGGGRPGWVR
jgi:AcrR family transcriptional regulator